MDTITETKEVPLTNGMVALVDADDYERVMEAGPWYYAPNSVGGNDYAGRSKGGRMHRFVLGLTDPKVAVDHINGDGLDNRKANLRPATPKQNAANRGTTRANASGFKGVRQVPNGRWRAEVCLRGKTNPTHVGMHSTAEEAARARDAFVRKHKDPAYEQFNFPLPGERGLDGKVV